MECLKCGREFWSAESRYCNDCVLNWGAKGMTKVTECMLAKIHETMREYVPDYLNTDLADDIRRAMTAAQDSGEQISKEKVAEVKHRSFPQLRVEDAFLQWWHAESGWSEGAEDDASLSEGNLAREAFKAGALLAVPNAVQVDREDEGVRIMESYIGGDMDEVLAREIVAKILSTEDTQ